jgi:hypothetical protein
VVKANRERFQLVWELKRVEQRYDAALNAAQLQEQRGRYELAHQFLDRASAADDRAAAIKARLAQIGAS